LTFLTPGVTVEMRYGTVVLGPDGTVAAAAAACTEDDDTAAAASVALVRLNPSGYWKMTSPGSPGRENPGWTGLMERLFEPQLPTQKLDTSDMSSQIPSTGMSLCQLDRLLVHQVPASLLSQSNIPVSESTGIQS